MTNLFKEIITIINFDFVVAIGLMAVVFFAAKKRGLQERKKRVEVREKEPEVVW